MLPRLSRALVLLLVVVLTTAGLTGTAAAKPKDPRTTQGLFVDPLMPAANQDAVYARSIGRTPQALWIIPEAYPTGQVARVVRAYTSRAVKAKKTPMLTIYGIPDRDCGMYSSGGLPGAKQYKQWIKQIGRGLKAQRALVVLEPDAIPFYGDSRCQNAGGRLGLLRYASRLLSKVGAWVYLDAGHSDWRPYDNRAALLKKAGIAYDRGFSTNVSNFRSTADEKAYAGELLRGLRKLGVKGRHFVIDTSRNGNPNPVNGDVINPTWARLGAKPRLVFQGPFDGTLWVKHPGESDGYANGGPASGQWCDLLADRLLGRAESGSC
ncbi:glycoside hydrolase family 6 protein [Nocardioides hankookensis]|uniref:Glucanase n=1 Tax=Nocardioides hankookensis TaxID=443157 RepID=A0ABW1LDK3_9ACTN